MRYLVLTALFLIISSCTAEQQAQLIPLRCHTQACSGKIPLRSRHDHQKSTALSI